MNSMKRSVQAVTIAGLLILGWGIRNEVQASGNPDTMTVMVTPGVTYAVAITSPAVAVQGYDFTTVNIGQSTISTKPIGVANAGNCDEFFSIGVVDVTPSVAWANALNPATTTYAMHALFVGTGAPQPSTSTFAVDTLANYAPEAAPGTANGKFGQGSSKTLPGASQDLYLLLRMPTAVHDSSQHTLTLSINGQGS